MYALAISKFDIPGEPNFPLNSVYARPANANDAGKCQLINELLKCYKLINYELAVHITTNSEP